MVAGSAWVGELALQHLDAAYNVARWILGNEPDASDAVHDAYLRATRAAHTYAGGDSRAWWLAIVRNCCLARISATRREPQLDETEGARLIDALLRTADDEVERHMSTLQMRSGIERALRALPLEFREALVLREIEDLSYREIADVLDVPIGTVMSRLSRGRALLQRALGIPMQEALHGL
jgi:RNA polymerase sigma-70 factor (ECF subfamily)